MTLNDYSKQIVQWRKHQGFITPNSIDGNNGDLMLGKLMLVVTEVAEGAEAVRHNDLSNFKEELADVFIRLFDICGTMNIDIEKQIELKMAKNRQRPFRHGTKTQL